MNEKRAKMLLSVVAANNPVELAIGFVRYKALRKLTPRQFQELHEKNLAGIWYDNMVDELIEKD